MFIERIVSFLPSATELLYEFGMEKQIYGVTHECKYPLDAITKPQIIKSTIDSNNLTSKEINDKTCQLLNNGKDIFVLDEDKLKKANPDLIITQDTCKVCTAYTNQVNRAIEILQKKPIIYSMDPHNIEEIITSISEIGRILKRETKAKEITIKLEKRIEKIKQNTNNKILKVLAIEWIEPFFTAGHWVPEMIDIAGGVNMISKKSERSKRIELEEIVKSDPDKIIMMPCGFDVERTIVEYNNTLKNNETWRGIKAVKNNQVFAVNADTFFSKPSIRTVEGIEILAKIIQPDKFKNTKIKDNSMRQIRHSNCE